MLSEQRDILQSTYNLTCRVTATASRRHGCTAAGAALRFVRGHRASRALDADLKVVVETTTLDIERGEPAIAHVRAGFAAGCHVVTANKGPVAFACEELTAAATAAGVRFLFEGAVMDGIPIFNLVRETLPAVRITGFEGRQHDDQPHHHGDGRGARLRQRSAQMQADGIAEADASLDVDGWDAAAKTAALANILLAARMTPRTSHAPALGPPWAIGRARPWRVDTV